MTKRDFLNALVNPTHAEIKVKLRTLRKELRAINWTLKYRYCKKSHTFFMYLRPTAMSKRESRDVRRLLIPLAKVNNVDMDVDSARNGDVYADIYIIQQPGFLV